MSRRSLPAGVLSALMAAVLLFTGAVAHASPLGDPGGGSSEEDSENSDLYLAIGATAVVVSIILYDIFSDAAREEEAADSAGAAVEDTGVDWESVPVAGGRAEEEAGEEEPESLALVVETLPGEDGGSASELLASRLGLILADTPVEVDPSPVSIGQGYTSAEKARMVADFFSSDLFLSLQPLDSGLLKVELLDGEGARLASDTLQEADVEVVSEMIRESLPR
ncbi:MAG: hypothetical protein R6U36_07145 [Candidatus Fermentibacteraceae bacterium]